MSSTHVCPQRKKLLVGRALYGALDFPVTRDERKAKRREDSAAAVLATRLPLDGVAPADTIDLVHQVPRPLVGHVHRPARGGDRTAGTNILKQLDLPGPMRASVSRSIRTLRDGSDVVEDFRMFG